MRAKTIWWDEAMRLFPSSENSDFELSAERERRAFMEGVLFSSSQVILANMNTERKTRMGAEYKTMNVTTKDKEAVESTFLDAQETDRYANGHYYSGGFGMATGLTFKAPEKFTSDDAADDWLQENAEKWGDALAVWVSEDGNPHYRIGAVCAS